MNEMNSELDELLQIVQFINSVISLEFGKMHFTYCNLAGLDEPSIRQKGVQYNKDAERIQFLLNELILIIEKNADSLRMGTAMNLFHNFKKLSQDFTEKRTNIDIIELTEYLPMLRYMLTLNDLIMKICAELSLICNKVDVSIDLIEFNKKNKEIK